MEQPIVGNKETLAEDRRKKLLLLSVVHSRSESRCVGRDNICLKHNGGVGEEGDV